MWSSTKTLICKNSGGALQKSSILRHLHSLRLSLTTKAAGEEPELASHSRHETPFVVFDTAKGPNCRLTTRRRNILTWYSCGPTVYDSAHIGHASSFIRQDVIRRILEGLNKEMTVIQVMGITDIDDKIIRKANDTGAEWNSVSKHYEREFIEDLTKIGVLSPHAFVRVSDFIPQIIAFVNKLMKTGYAYASPDGSVYFDTEKYGSQYGIFGRVQTDEAPEADLSSTSLGGKRNPRDFALWKGAKQGEPFWNSPWTAGKGRPGWHIECSVMASQYFGPSLDLHTGGRDLVFPHHENEEAQCCAHFNSSHWTSHWLHMGHLQFKGDVKMSKSLGNTVSIRSFLDEHSPDVLRVICIMSKYRNNLEYSSDITVIAGKILKKLHGFLNDTSAILQGSKPVKADPSQTENDLWGKLETAKERFHMALLNDFDTPEALKTVTELISDFNRHYVPNDGGSDGSSNALVNYELVLAVNIFVQDFLKLMGLSLSPTMSTKGSTSGGPQQQDPRLENVLHQFVEFRNQVRSYSLAMGESDKETRRQRIAERKELLEACDRVRKQMLTESHVEIKDHGKTSSWSFVADHNMSKKEQ